MWQNRLDEINIDLAKLAIVGNVGDMMAREKCGLVGPARDIIVEDGIRHQSVEVRKKDLNCYGTATRPVHLSLAYNDDPFIRGISNNPEGARQFLKRLGIRQQSDNGRWFVWEEMAPEDKRTIISALAEQLIANGERVDRLLAETYGFPDELPRTPLRNAQEYATMLNACGRWSKPHVGGAILRGTGELPTVTPNICSTTTGQLSATCSSISSIPVLKNYKTSSGSMWGGGTRIR